MFKMNQPDEAVSCTRAGLLIVILSGLGLSLLEPLEIHLAMRDFGKYIALRNALAAQLDDLDHNPCFKKYLQIDNMSLSTLSESDCIKHRKPESNAALEAIKHLAGLTNHELIQKAQRGSFQREFSVFSWSIRANTFKEGVGNIGMLTFGSAKELSAFEFPELSTYKELFLINQVIHTQWTPLSVRLTNAGTFVASGLLLAMAYFWVFFQEATKSGNSNKDGTIFTAVRRTRFSRILFFLFMAIPPIVVGLLLRMSYRINEEPRFWNASTPDLDTILFVGVVIMSALIWRTAQIDWKRTTAHTN